MLTSRFRLLCAAALCGLPAWSIVVFVLPRPFMPGGVWFRQVPRDNCLEAPITVLSASTAGLSLGDGRWLTLAGISIPPHVEILEAADQLLQVSCKQGVEVLRVVPGKSAAVVLCEPRIWHPCGNDPVAAHFEQAVLNDLLLASGLAVVHEASLRDLCQADQERMRIGEELARDRAWGVWGPAGSRRMIRCDPEFGISVSDFALCRP